MKIYKGLLAMEWDPKPDAVFACGFRQESQPYARYVNHISMCTHRDCDRRYANHLELREYFVGKFGHANQRSVMR